jgi:hypothetical protein
MVRVRGREALPLLSLKPRKKRRGRGEGRCSAGDFQSDYPGQRRQGKLRGAFPSSAPAAGGGESKDLAVLGRSGAKTGGLLAADGGEVEEGCERNVILMGRSWMANMRHDMLRVRALEALSRKSAGNGCIKAIEGRFVEGMMWTRRWFCYRLAIWLFDTTDIFIGGRTEQKGGFRRRILAIVRDSVLH